jgi:hypothetical protein
MLLAELALVDATLVDDGALAGVVVMLEVLLLEVELELDAVLDDCEEVAFIAAFFCWRRCSL